MSRGSAGRNDPCPCGSGRKFKHCCYRTQQFSGSISHPARLGDGASFARPRDREPPPKPKVRVSVGYTFADGFGTGEVSYGFERNQLFCLTDGRVVDAEHIAIGMRFHLEGEMVATVTKVGPPKVVPPPPPGKDENGNSIKRIVGTVKYLGHYPVMDLVVGDLHIRTTPGHRFYSVNRQGWVDAGSLYPGEHLQNEQGQVAPVTHASPPRFEPVNLYNVEVEDFHTYFVGQAGGTAVWSHNGMEGGCSVPKPADAAKRQRQIPESDGYWSSSPAKGAPKDGVPGESYWHSTDPLITSHPEYRPIKFTNRYPDFSPITKVTVEIGVTGKPGFRDHFAASKALAKRLIAEPGLAEQLGIPVESYMKKNGSPHASAVYEWMKAQPNGGLTWHHLEDARTMALVPWAVHEIPHAGGAAIAREAARRAAGD